MDELQKIYWDNIKHQIRKVDNEFARLVDEISPDEEYPLYLSSYKYGETIGDNLGTILKNKDGEIYRLGDQATPKDIFENLGYGISNSPLMMILDKKFEWYIFDQPNQRSFPIYIEGPGFFIGTRQLLSEKKSKTYISSSIMSCTAGTRSAFMLPNIGNQKNHMALQRQLGVSGSPPKEMQDHWEIFKEIYSSSNKNWQAKIIFFSKKWVESLKSDPKWIYLQRYLIEKIIKSWEHDKNYFFYNFAFSSAHTKKNIIKNTYLNETAKHILGIAIGANLGFKPSTDDQSLPLNTIQHAYKKIYQLKHNPVLLEPSKFDINCKEQLPIYYSLQRPIVCSLEKQTKTEPRALVNLHYLNRMLSKYLEAFSSKDSTDCYSGTSLQEIAEKINFTYYHHSPKDTENPIQSSAKIEKEDSRFSISKLDQLDTDFPSDARFFRGCIKISI